MKRGHYSDMLNIVQKSIRVMPKKLLALPVGIEVSIFIQGNNADHWLFLEVNNNAQSRP